LEAQKIVISDEELNKPLKEMEEYDQAFDTNTEFFSSYNPDMIEEAFTKHLVDGGIEHQVNDKKYKIKFKKFVTDDYDSKVNEALEIVMRILLVKEQNKCCVEFTRKNGRLKTFLDHFKNIKQTVLKFADDSV
jgi:hypothetical protein